MINWSGQLRISSVVSEYRNTRWPLVLLVLLLGSSRSDCQQVQSDEFDAKYGGSVFSALAKLGLKLTPKWHS